jgi:hypothetical protein
MKHEMKHVFFHKKQLTAANLFLAAVTRWVSNESDTFANSSETKQELMSQRRFMVIILILFTIASMMRKTVGT